jgi:hypothetical protein
MNGISYLTLFFPIVLVILIVLESCRSDNPAKILKRTLSNFGALSVVLLLGGALVYLINRFL